MVLSMPGTSKQRNGNKDWSDPPRRRILLTNGRFPVSLDLARQLYWAGHHVFCVDPMEYHVCKFSIAVEQSQQVPAPHTDGKGYVRAVKDAVEKWKIDLIVPVHEEIFFLAECDERVILDKLLAPPWHVLVRMHSKWEFTKMMRRLDLGVPEARLCTSKKDVRNLDRSREWAVKPVFGRASSNVYHLKPGKPIPEDIDVSEHNHYIAQEWIKGKRYCSYSVLRRGKLQAHGVYPVLDTIDGSSSVYFQQCDHPGIKAYMKKLASQLPMWNGQIALDFVEHGGDLVTMECNPRATSGVHLWSDTPLLARALTGSMNDRDTNDEGYVEPQPTFTGSQPHRQLAPGMLMWEHDLSPKVFAKHMIRLTTSKDVIWKTRDMMPSIAQPFLLTVYYKICWQRKQKLPDMFQWDLTWEPDDGLLDRLRKMMDDEDERDDAARRSSGSGSSGQGMMLH